MATKSGEGRLIVITGASQGIGAATAIAFARSETCRLVLVSRNTSKMDAVAEECAKTGSAAHVMTCDVTDERAVSALCESVQSRLGVPDVVVNNAGAFEPSMIAETTLSVWERQVAANLTSAFLVTTGFLDKMSIRGSGTFVFLGSVASIKGYPGGAAYCAAKHGVLGFARSLREECKDKGVGVVTLLPGATFTPSWEGAGLPEDRFIPKEDIADLIVTACNTSHRTVIEEILVRPQLGDI